MFKFNDVLLLIMTNCGRVNYAYRNTVLFKHIRDYFMILQISFLQAAMYWNHQIHRFNSIKLLQAFAFEIIRTKC